VTRSVHHPAYAKLLSCLIAARKDAGLHQSQVAARLGRPQSFVSKFENGERRLDVVEFLFLCQALEADPAAILAKVASALERDKLAL
jgi:transcriptional regulator with XRE-family HTH domain